MNSESNSTLLWSPSAETMANSEMYRFKAWLEQQGHGTFADYDELHRWSVSELETFWDSVWKYCGLQCEKPAEKIIGNHEMPGTQWFPGMQLNFAANLLRFAESDRCDQEAVVAYCETRPTLRKTYSELKADVGAFESFLRNRGIGRGDRVAGVVTNGYEALVGMLATTSLGAIWSSASPDFGVGALCDRFEQIEPSALIIVNGYGFGGKIFCRQKDFAKLITRLPTLKTVISVQQLPDEPHVSGSLVTTWEEALAFGVGQSPTFASLPADHPVYILFSSGTTGKPKCIVHGSAGILVNHAKELMLHGDVGPNDRFLYFTTCGWMMWNWQASALMTGATIITVDGSPGYPRLDSLWQTVSNEQVSHFGISARFIAACRKEGLNPNETFDQSQLRTVFSTGSPLLQEDFDWIYRHGAPNVLLASIAGGTDICGCFLGSSPLLPVHRGEIQCQMLGVDAVAFGDDGQPVSAGKGELICRQPLPSMPIGFWNDSDDSLYHKAYFDKFPGVWAHGDFVEFTKSKGAIIHGRSDATLNPGGVRIGTAEIYRQVETIEVVKDSLVVGRQVDGDVEVVLFVVLTEDSEMTDDLRRQIKERIRQGASPRHVPKHTIEVTEIPYTRSGKKVELAVARLINGSSKQDNRDALSNPKALDIIAEKSACYFEDLNYQQTA